MLYGPGLRLSQIHDKLRLAKDKKFIPLVNILPRWLLPNHVTAFRSLILLAWFPFAILHPRPLQIIIYIIIYFLDLLDGAMARLKKQETYLGEYFDHISDKFNNVALLFVLFGVVNYHFIIFKFFIGWDLLMIALLVVECLLRKKEISYLKTPLDLVEKIVLFAFLILKIAPLAL